MFSVTDDGTLDTVLQCSRCDAYLRYDSESLLDDDAIDWLEKDNDFLCDLRIARAIEDAEFSHECEEC